VSAGKEVSFEREFGSVQAEIKHLTHIVNNLNMKVEKISETLSEAKGGWRTLMWVAGASSTVGGVVTYFLQHFHFR
jgi:hypothetical protein